MSRRRRFDDGWFTPPPKQPVPAAGIAAGRFGTTWWGREWIASLERLGGAWSNRLPRGRSYARAGRVVDLEIGAGIVTAGAVGTRPRPYRIELRLTPHSAAAWRRGLERLAEDTLLVIQLLDRELPEAVAARLADADVALFPRRGELRTSCSCPDSVNPCKHVAAVHYVLAAALDNDPFLIFRLRGLDRDGLLAALGDGAAATAPAPVPATDDAGDGTTEPAGELDLAAFLGRDLTPPVLDLEPRAPAVELVGLKRLGPPPRGLERLPELVAPAVRAASRFALELAWRDADERPVTAAERAQTEIATKAADRLRKIARAIVAPAAPVAPPRRRGRRPQQSPLASQPSDEPRPRARPLTDRIEEALADIASGLPKRALVDLLGTEPADVTAALDRLRRARIVAVRGRGAGTRYLLAPQAASEPGRRRGRRPSPPAGSLANRVVDLLGRSRTAQPARTLAERLGVTTDELRPVLLTLRQHGVIEMIGRRRAARYRRAG